MIQKGTKISQFYIIAQLDKRGNPSLAPLLDSLEYIKPPEKSAVSPYEGFQVIKKRNMCEPCKILASAIKISTPALLFDESDQQSQLFLLRRISHHAGLQPGGLNNKSIIGVMKQQAVWPNDMKQVQKVVQWIVMDDQLPIGFHQVPNVYWWHL